MKQGKLAFPWQAIRSWISPAPPSVVSKHDSTLLNLPLDVLMPLFMARLKSQLPTSNLKLETLPDRPGTDFKSRYLSPTAVVTRASALPAVAGSLVVLPEGLLVAAKLSTNQNPDELAAFLARALGRVNQCAQEAHVGELSDLEFTAQGVPWKIFRLPGVLFAAFGRAGGRLPITELAAIAGEFERKK
jgi:hypothetical protein